MFHWFVLRRENSNLSWVQKGRALWRDGLLGSLREWEQKAGCSGAWGGVGGQVCEGAGRRREKGHLEAGTAQGAGGGPACSRQAPTARLRHTGPRQPGPLSGGPGLRPRAGGFPLCDVIAARAADSSANGSLGERSPRSHPHSIHQPPVGGTPGPPPVP